MRQNGRTKTAAGVSDSGRPRPGWIVYLGLLLLVVSLPFESAFLGLEENELSITRLLGIAIFSLWVLKLLLQWRCPTIPRPLIYGSALIAWAGLSLLWAADKEAARQGFATAAQLLALAILAVNEIGSIQRLKGLLVALFVGCVGVSVMGLLGIGTSSGGWLLTLEGQGAKEYGAYVGIAFLLSGLLLMFGPVRTKLAAAGAALLSLGASPRLRSAGCFSRLPLPVRPSFPLPGNS